MPLSDRVDVALVIITIISLGGALYSWYCSQFRYHEVLSWSIEAIKALQRLFLVINRDHRDSILQSHEPTTLLSLDAIADEISILVEVGRVFFSNSPGRFELEGWGNEKPGAYQGLRPKILDYLIGGYEVAMEWPKASRERREDLLAVALEAQRQLVTVIQREVGRPRSISPHARAQGMSSPVNWILQDLRDRESRFSKRMVR